MVSPVKSALFDIERALQRDEITPEHAGQLIGALGAEGAQRHSCRCYW